MRFPVLASLAACAALLAGCAGPVKFVDAPMGATHAEPVEARHHMFYLDRSGYLLDPNTKDRLDAVSADDEVRTAKRAQTAEESYTVAMLAEFRRRQDANPELQMTLHVHGGLNEFEDVRQRAVALSGHMLHEDHYPIFVGWPSGPFSNYGEYLLRSDRGERRRGWIKRIAWTPFLLLEDVARSVARAPVATWRQVEQALDVSITRFDSEEQAYEQRIDRLDKKFTVVNPPPYTGVGSSYWSMVNPVWLLTSPFVDGLGNGAWSSMLRRTDLVLTKASVYETVTDVRDLNVEALSQTALTRFLKAMEKMQLPRPKINLIGHSMGAIVGLNILARHPTLKFDNVVFMGAAAPVKDLENVLVPWMARHSEARFYNLSLDPYNEVAERVWYDAAPRGSLLVWIDNIFGEVNSFRDRTAGRWWNIARTAEDLFPERFAGVPVRNRVVLKRFPIGAQFGPQTHGDFDEYCFWRAGYWSSKDPSLPLVAGRNMNSCLDAENRTSGR